MSTPSDGGSFEAGVKPSQPLAVTGGEDSALTVAMRRVQRQRSATIEEIRGHTDTPHQDFGHSNSWI